MGRSISKPSLLVTDLIVHGNEPESWAHSIPFGGGLLVSDKLKPRCMSIPNLASSVLGEMIRVVPFHGPKNHNPVHAGLE